MKLRYLHGFDNLRRWNLHSTVLCARLKSYGTLYLNLAPAPLVPYIMNLALACGFLIFAVLLPTFVLGLLILIKSQYITISCHIISCQIISYHYLSYRIAFAYI